MRPMNCETRAPGSSKDLSLTILAVRAGPDGHLPKGAKAPKSTMGGRRAIILGIVQVLMLAHIAQWLWTGNTIKPIEPSDSMDAIKDGVVNAGAIFFAIALLSTAILGRWFCGWGCHIVMLQDLCGWLMKRIGIRPKLFRSRLLLWLPFLLAVYMFIWPIAYRLAIAPYTRPDLTWPGFRGDFTTTDYWATFPGLWMAIPFLLVCGFLTVYLLGAKGYCTYGCPYGGFFAPLDEISPLRIRVTDACTECGHCTAVCTSNVRVHEEVRDFRMVVDQGCMKCLDCVSACPEQALYVGWGKPAFLAKNRNPGKSVSRFDLTGNEELALAAVAIASFFVVRGPIGVPLLFASGIAACTTYLAWLCASLLRTRDVRLHQMQLKRDGRVRASGAAVLAVSGAVFAALAYFGAINSAMMLARFERDRVTVPAQVVFSGTKSVPNAAERAIAQRACSLYEFTQPWPAGYGFAGPWQSDIESNVAWLSCVLGNYTEAERILREGAEREGMNEVAAASIARVMRGDGRFDDAVTFARSHWEAHPEWERLREELLTWLVTDGQREMALEIARLAVKKRPQDLNAIRRLSLILVESVVATEVEEGLMLIDITLQMAPGNPYALRARAQGLRTLGRTAEAEEALNEGLAIAPDDWLLVQELGELLMATDRMREGAVLLKKAGEMRSQPRAPR